MKKRRGTARKRRVLLLICAAAGLMVLAACCLLWNGARPDDPFDPALEGLVDVRTRTLAAPDQPTGTEQCYVLAKGKRIRQTAAFTPDDATVRLIPDGCVESYLDDARGVVANRLIRAAWTDEQGVSLPVPDRLLPLFSRLAELEHDLFHIRVFCTGEETFVFLMRNVNLWTPCALYYYNPVSETLTELFTWSSEEVVSLRIRNPALLRTVGAPAGGETAPLP